MYDREACKRCDVSLKKLVHKNKIIKYYVITTMGTAITAEVTFPAQCSADVLPVMRDMDLNTFEKSSVSVSKNIQFVKSTEATERQR